MDASQINLHPINREGYPFIFGVAILALVLFAVYQPLGWLGVIATGIVTYFFRDPDRVTPVRPGLVVSPADGLITAIVPAVPPEELGLGDDPMMRITIVLNIFDVHITRNPADGVVVRSIHRPGEFKSVVADKASDNNERQSIHVKLASGRDVVAVHIAGQVARRIVCPVRDAQAVSAGQRTGMIRFGSRVDLYLDDKLKPMVMVGQRAIGGETVMADEKSREAQRMGEVR